MKYTDERVKCHITTISLSSGTLLQQHGDIANFFPSVREEVRFRDRYMAFEICNRIFRAYFKRTPNHFKQINVL